MEKGIKTYVFCQHKLLLGVQSVGLHFGCSSVTNIGTSATIIFCLNCLHLVVHVLLLIEILIGLVDDSLSDATRSTLLLVVVESSVDPALLARPHI